MLTYRSVLKMSTTSNKTLVQKPLILSLGLTWYHLHLIKVILLVKFSDKQTWGIHKVTGLNVKPGLVLTHFGTAGYWCFKELIQLKLKHKNNVFGRELKQNQTFLKIIMTVLVYSPHSWLYTY